MNIVDYLYNKLRYKEVSQAKLRLKKLSINTIYENISKECWKNNIQYQVIIKNTDMIIIKLDGKRKSKLLKYDKSPLVLFDEYNKFLSFMDEYRINEGIYIAAGVFEGKIIHGKSFLYNRRVILLDSFKFIKNQLGLCKKSNEIFKFGRLNFIKFFPY